MAHTNKKLSHRYYSRDGFAISIHNIPEGTYALLQVLQHLGIKIHGFLSIIIDDEEVDHYGC